jgi:hypothetical protein
MALVGDSVDANGDWPLYTGANNSGWVRQTVGWNAGETGERAIRLPTNQVLDRNYSVDLHLRLASAAGIVRQTANVGAAAVGAKVSVAGGQLPPPVTTSSPPGTDTKQGGGSLDAWALISLILLIFRLIVANARRGHALREPVA